MTRVPVRVTWCLALVAVGSPVKSLQRHPQMGLCTLIGGPFEYLCVVIALEHSVETFHDFVACNIDVTLIGSQCDPIFARNRHHAVGICQSAKAVAPFPIAESFPMSLQVAVDLLSRGVTE